MSARLRPPVGEMRLSRHAHARGALIEPRQQRHQPVERAFVDAFRSDRVIEHAALVQPAHHDQPVDHGAAAGERQAMPHRRQRNHVDIHVAGEPAVEPELGAAGGLAARQRREVEVGKTHRLFQLVDARPGEKHPRHMRLAHDHLVGAVRIGVGTAEERDLLRHARGRRSAGGHARAVGERCSRALQGHSRSNESSAPSS